MVLFTPEALSAQKKSELYTVVQSHLSNNPVSLKWNLEEHHSRSAGTTVGIPPESDQTGYVIGAGGGNIKKIKSELGLWSRFNVE